MNEINKPELIEAADSQPIKEMIGGVSAWFKVLWMPLLLILGTFVVFWPVRKHGFINLDDPDYVYSNRHVRSGLTMEGVNWAFSTTRTANWHPLTWVSLMADVRLFGVNPAGHHLVNVLFHSFNAALLFVLLYRLTGGFWRSALVAGLFAVHPVHVESVAWIAERKDVLSTFFGLATLIFYCEYGKRNSRCQVSGATSRGTGVWGHGLGTWNYFLALVSYGFGLLSKPMLVTLPFVMLLLDFWPLARNKKFETGNVNRETEDDFKCARLPMFKSWSWLAVEKLPFFVLSAVFCLITFQVQKGNGAVVALSKIPVGLRIENVFVSYALYLGKLFWPIHLALPYPYPSDWPRWTVTLSVALVAGLSAIAWRLGQRAPFVAMGWFWFLGTLVPVIGIVQVGNQPMADRYDYFPSIGIFIAVTWGLAKFLTAFAVGRCSVVIGDEKAEPNRTVMVPDASTLSGCSAWWGSGLALVVAVGTLAMCVARTRQQLTYWADSETLFRHTVAITKNNSIALDNLGLSLLNQGKPDEAMEYYNAALRIHPKDPIARDGTGCCYFQKGQLEEAISNFKLGLEISTNQPTTFFNLGSALAQLGHFEEAIPYFEATLQLEPDDPDAYLSLGNVNYRLQRFNEAAAWFGRAVQVLPEDSGAHRSLSACLFAAGRFAEAETECERVLKLAPDDLRIRTLLARILMQQNRPEEARRQLDVVLRDHPDDPEARELLTSLGR